MAIAFVAATSAYFDSTDPTCPIPAGAAAGDLLLAMVQLTPYTTMTPPTGWTLFTGMASGENPTTYGHVLFWKFMEVSEPTAVWTGAAGGDGGVVMAAYSGVDATTPIESVYSAVAGGSTNIDYPAFVSQTDNAYAVAMTTRYNNGAYGLFGAPPSPFTTRHNEMYNYVSTWYWYAQMSDVSLPVHHTITDPGTQSFVISSNRSVFIAVLRASGETVYATGSRVSQLPVEVLRVGVPETRVSQLILEVLQNYVAPTNEDVNIDHVAAGTVLQFTGPSPFALDLPDGIATGDLLVAFIATNQADGKTFSATGWTQIPGTPVSPPIVTWGMAGLYRVADGSEGATMSFEYDGSQAGTGAAICHAWRGVDTTTPFAVNPISAEDEDNAPAYRVGVSQVVPVDEVLAVFATVTSQTSDPANPISFAVPWVERENAQSTSANISVDIAERGYAGATGVGAGSVTYTQAQVASYAAELIMLLLPGIPPPDEPVFTTPYVIMVGD